MIDPNVIADSDVRLFYLLYLPQYTILKDFYTLLPSDRYDYRMVDTPERKADSPRESLAHLLEYRWLVLEGVKTGNFAFKDIGVGYYWQATKDQLLAEWERFEQQMFDHLTSKQFVSGATIATPWEAMTAINLLYLIRDHDILHVGWNLALMDHLGMERFPSLKDYWG